MELSKELIEKITERASRDAAFKKQLTKDPIGAIEAFTGRKLSLNDFELNETELEAISGGNIFTDAIEELTQIVDTVKKSFSGGHVPE